MSTSKDLGKDINGKESSKRYWARILIVSGLTMTWITFLIWVIVSTFFYKGELNIPIELIYIQLGTGLGALGFTIGEGLRGRGKEPDRPPMEDEE